MSDNTLRIFKGAVAVITGGASGIGRALAEELSRRGSEVILADLQIELAEEAALAIQTAGGKAQAFELDVRDGSAIDSLLKSTIERTGRLDYLFNNAGIGMGGSIGLHTREDWDQVIDTNFRGVVNGVYSVYPIMLKQGFGHIVNTASISGLVPSPGTVAYTAAKHAVVGLSMSLRAEVAAAGIRVTVLCPGAVDTAILEGGGKYGKFYIDIEQQRQMWKQLKPIPPKEFAHGAINAIARNEAIIIAPLFWRLLWWLYRLSPTLLMSLMQKQLEAMLLKARS